MDILSIVIIIFLTLEIANVVMLYFVPGTKKGNGLGVFNALEKAKENHEIYALLKYLINWVAGTKLIFIALLIVILITGNEATKIYAIIALILSITTYYWRLHPIIKKLDTENQITPKGYSKTLGRMIAVFIFIFISALAIYWLI